MPRKIKLTPKPIGRPPGNPDDVRSIRCLVSLKKSEADKLKKPLATSIYDIVKSHLEEQSK